MLSLIAGRDGWLQYLVRSLPQRWFRHGKTRPMLRAAFFLRLASRRDACLCPDSRLQIRHADCWRGDSQTETSSLRLMQLSSCQLLTRCICFRLRRARRATDPFFASSLSGVLSWPCAAWMPSSLQAPVFFASWSQLTHTRASTTPTFMHIFFTTWVLKRNHAF